MHFTPKTEKEIAEANLWPAGEYSFEIAKAENAVSKSGNEMIKLSLNIVNNEAKSKVVFDYLLEAIEYKLRHCADACGLLVKYETGMLDAMDFEGKTGVLKLGIQKGTDRYPNDKNSISDYIVGAAKPATPVKFTSAQQSQATEVDLDDEVPY